MSQILDVIEDHSDDEVSLQQERNELRQEVQRLRALLHEKETACFKAEEELSQIKRVCLTCTTNILGHISTFL